MDELSSHETRRDRGRRVGLRDLIKLRLTWFAFTFFFFSTLVFGALQNFAPSLLRDLYGFSLAAATSALTAYLLGSVSLPGWTVIGIMALMGFGVGIAGPSRDMLVRTSTAARLGTGAFGRIYGLVYSGLDVGLATAPLIFGVLMDAGKTRFVFVGLSISLLFAIIAAQAIAGEAQRTY